LDADTGRLLSSPRDFSLNDERLSPMTSSRPLRHLAFVCLALLLAFVSVGSVGMTSRATAQDTAPEEMTKVEVVEQVSPAVVTVFNLATTPALFGQQVEPQPQGAGTGFIIDKEGHIVTNWHVVTGGDAFAVLLADGTQLEAELIGSDARDDLAVVKIDPAAVPATVSFGDSTSLMPGQDVLAIGSPLGAFTNSVTAGIVSALGRNQLSSGNPSCQNYSNLIQHDAAINHGNSGGPLFNLRGEVVGVNTLGIPVDQSGQPVQGLFFAVPSSTVKVAVEQLIETGTVTQAWVGIAFYPIDAALATQYELPVESGIIITDVDPASPAAEAGLQPEDIITAVDGEEITPSQDLAAIMFKHQPGDVVTLSVIRGNEEMEIELTLGEAPLNMEQCTLQGAGE
jgi:2-alkenal reductase